jgi:CRISPR-associated protein Csb1
MWDSRPDKDDNNKTTHFKAPRLITSRIDAYGVDLLTKNGAFIPSVTNDDLHAADRADDAPKLSSLGLAMVPIHGLGGARLTATGRILRQVTINIVNARALRPHGGEGLALRRYILGLTLVAATAPQEAYLRQGCLLVRTEGPAPQFTGVYRDGTRRPLTLDHGALLDATRSAAAAFGVGEDRSASFSNVSVPKEVKKRGKAS